MDGRVSSHANEFILAGTEKFIDEIAKKIEEKLEISNMEDDELILEWM